MATYGWRLYAFVLMDNHEHLYVQTPRANLSAGMQFLNGSYTSYFNGRHRRVGHLFQGRYRAQLVEDQGHDLELSRYIHLNPCRAGLVTRPQQWRWSSYGYGTLEVATALGYRSHGGVVAAVQRYEASRQRLACIARRVERDLTDD